MLVFVDNNSGWPEALFKTNPTTERVLEFFAEYIAQHGIPQRIRTEPGTAFKSQKFRQFFEANYTKHLVCPIKDHQGNGKVERMITTLNERLREDSKERNNKNLSKTFLALRTAIANDRKSVFEREKKQKR